MGGHLASLPYNVFCPLINSIIIESFQFSKRQYEFKTWFLRTIIRNNRCFNMFIVKSEVYFIDLTSTIIYFYVNI